MRDNRCSKSIKVKKRNSVINQFIINPDKASPGQSTTISGRLEWDRTLQPNDPILNASVGLYIGNTHIATKTTNNNDGRFSHNYLIPANIQSGGSPIKAVFPGDVIYKPCSKSGTLTIELLTNLSVSPSSFNPYSENSKAGISYYLYEPSKITIEIIKDNTIVKTLLNLADRASGNQVETWYGTIDKGIPYDILIAPCGSYKIRVVAKPNNGSGPDEKNINVEVKSE